MVTFAEECVDRIGLDKQLLRLSFTTSFLAKPKLHSGPCYSPRKANCIRFRWDEPDQEATLSWDDLAMNIQDFGLI